MFDYEEITDEQAQEIEEAMYEAIDASEDWMLGDDGTMDTVLVCKCGKEHRFSDRESATDFALNETHESACIAD
jgi:hypothetical protein